jgi:autotransporter-associated beta strand protein
MSLSITFINQQFVYIGGSNFALDNIDNKNKIRRIYSFSGSNNSNVLRWTPNDPFSQFAFLEPNKTYWIESLAANFENYEIDNIEANEVSISFNITDINQFLKYDCETGYSLNNLDLSIKQKIRRIYTFTGANNSSISRWSPNDLFSQFLFFEPNKIYWVESLSENFTPYSLLEGCEPPPPMFEDSANYNQQANWNNTTSGNLTTAGSNGGPSAYHTYDQSGNVYEWNDLDDNTGTVRGLRGGSWNSTDVSSLSSASRLTDNPSLSNNTIGFRVASSSFHKNFIDSSENPLTSYIYISDRELFISALEMFNWCNVSSSTIFTLWTNWRPIVDSIPFTELDARVLYRSVVRSNNTNLNTFYPSIGCSLFTNLYEKLSSSASISSILASKLFIFGSNSPHYLVATLGSTSIICQPYIPSIFLNPTNNFVFIKDKINNNDINNYGNVDHYYSIGKHPVTNCEYVNFLNSVDPEGLNPQNIYDPSMSSSANGGIDFFSNNTNRNKYKVKNNMDSKPVVYVSWFDSARYCNWLSSGKQSYETTDNTEYAPQNFTIYNVGTDIEGDAIAKDLEFLSYLSYDEFGNELAQQYIPTENEWYKAAFYKGGGTNAGYWLYATQSDVLPEPVNSDEFGNGLINENPANNSDHLCAICIRSPFSEDCCESRQSSSNTVLTFTGPRTRRIPPLVNEPTKVTVRGTTESEILIHGVSFGSNNNPIETHVIDHTFFICADTFNIESVPCGSNFVNLNVIVCWEESFIENETLDYSGCSDITVLMSSCDCVTTLRYSGDKSTNFCMIDSSGDDPIVINDPVDVVSCKNYILTGTNLGNNEISSSINNPPFFVALNIIKTGSGKWILSGLNTYSGQLRVLDGTLVIGATVGLSVSGPFGEATSTALLPVVGSSAASTTGFAALLSAGFLVNRGFSVAKSGPGSTQTVIIGGVGTGTATFSGGHSIRLGRDVTLQASTGGTAVFASTWQNLDGGNDPNVAFTVGSPGNTGTVVFSSIIPDSITLFDVFPGATAKLDSGEETIYRETPVILGVSSTLDLNGTDQPLESLEMRGSATVTEGVLRTLDKIKAVGSENLIASDVIINAATTIDVSGSLTISGDVSGSSDLIKTGSGTLSLTGTLSYTGATNINAGTLEVESLVSGPPKISSSIFTPTTLIVEFTTIPLSNEQYRLLPGSTVQTYNSVILNNAGLATGTYNSATSTLEIN